MRIVQGFSLKPVALLCALPLLAQAPPQDTGVPLAKAEGTARPKVDESTLPKVDGNTLPKGNGPTGNRHGLPDRGPDPGDSALSIRFRRDARRNFVPSVAVPPGNIAIDHSVALPAGWMAYQVVAAPFETIKARLRSDHEGWFLVTVVNKWGVQEEGMLQNRIHRGNPEGSFINTRNEPRVVYFVVDTRILMESPEPYTLTFIRETSTPAKP